MSVSEDSNNTPPILWRKATAPKAWHPRAPRESLIGHFIGVREHKGTHGPYAAAYVRTSDGVFYVSGAVMLRLIDGTDLSPGDLIRIDYLGMKETTSGEFSYKDFDMYVGEGRQCRSCSGTFVPEAKFCPHCGVVVSA